MSSTFEAAETTEAFMEAATHAGRLIVSDRVAESWSAPSVLPLMTVGDLAGHLFLILRRVGQRIETAPPGPSDVTGTATVSSWTWLRVESSQDLDRPEHRTVRQDSSHVAEWGPTTVSAAYRDRLAKVTELISGHLPPAADVAGRPLPFVYYLATRVVELLVHADDLGMSVGVDVQPPKASSDIALRALLDAARQTHGDQAVLRSLTRRERTAGGISVF